MEYFKYIGKGFIKLLLVIVLAIPTLFCMVLDLLYNAGTCGRNVWVADKFVDWYTQW